MLRPGDRFVYALLTLILLGTLVWFFRYWSGVPEWSDRPAAMVGMTGFLVLFLGQFLQAWGMLPAMVRPVPPPPEPDRRVALVTTFVPGVESRAMLEATVRGMVGVRGVDAVWVLDEGDDPRVRELCERWSVHHFSRRSRPGLVRPSGRLRARTKYGNLNAWLDTVGFDRYDVIAAFDPDHVPGPAYLERVLGYFRDPGVGWVQAAQVYYNQGAGLVARGAAEESYTYYSSTLPAAFGRGYAVVVGCHSTHRVSALREVGGFAPHDADDLLTALEYQAAGWRGVYVPEVLAVGLTPTDWGAYLRQQRRWARSVFDIKLRHLPRLARRLPGPTLRLAALQGAGYVAEAALPLAGAWLLTSFLVTGEASVLTRLFGHPFLVLAAALAGIDLFRRRFLLDPVREGGLHWRAGLLRAVKWPAILKGLTEAAWGRVREYEITAKEGPARRPLRALLPHLGLTAVVGGAWAAAALRAVPVHWSLHVWSALAVTVGLALVGHAARRAPPAFDPDLLEEALPRLQPPSPRPSST